MNQNDLKELFYYKEGNLLWKVSRGNRAKIDGIAGSFDSSNGYRHVMLNKKKFYIHRLVWIYHNGEIPAGMQIDHIDRCRTNNNIENLRVLSEKNNKRNVAGVGAYQIGDKYMAAIRIDGKNEYLGYFNTKEEAMNRYNKAKEIILKEIHENPTA